MKKWIVAFIAVFWFVSCEIGGMGGADLPDFYYLHIRNMSTTSGVTFYHKNPTSYDTTYDYTSLDASPFPGKAVDTSLSILECYYKWKVERAIDSAIIDSGNVQIDCEKWLLVEEENSIWSCTWSDNGWD